MTRQQASQLCWWLVFSVIILSNFSRKVPGQLLLMSWGRCLSSPPLWAHLSREFICLLLITNKLCTAAVSVIYDTRTGIVSQSFTKEISSVFADLCLHQVAVSHRSQRHIWTLTAHSLLSSFCQRKLIIALPILQHGLLIGQMSHYSCLSLANSSAHRPLIGWCCDDKLSHMSLPARVRLQWSGPRLAVDVYFSRLAITDRVNIERAGQRSLRTSSCNAGKLEPRCLALTANQRTVFSLVTNQSAAYSASNALGRPGELGTDRVITSHLFTTSRGILKLSIGRCRSVMTFYWYSLSTGWCLLPDWRVVHH